MELLLRTKRQRKHKSKLRTDKSALRRTKERTTCFMDIMYILQTLGKTILEQHTGTCTDREFQGIIQNFWRSIFMSASIPMECGS